MTEPKKNTYTAPSSRALSVLALLAVNPLSGAMATAALAGCGHQAGAYALGGAVIATTLLLASLRALDLLMDVDTTALMSMSDSGVSIDAYLRYRRYLLTATLISGAVGAVIGILTYIA